jgi:predicted homoserine dehydrogenase-like protein
VAAARSRWDGIAVIIVDRALRQRAEAGRPIRVGLVGAGFMGRAIARQIATTVPGMEVVAIANRTLERACEAFAEAGVEAPRLVESPDQLQCAVADGIGAVTDDPSVLCRAESVDAVVEATGSIEFAARVVAEAIDHGKHVVLSNAELDGTVGPILKHRADRAGVVFTDIDGDQPGAELNMYRFVVGIGLRPLVCGNIKGLMDHYRTPETQRGFAERWGQNAPMVTSFADGSKISFEQAVVANATGMRVQQRGMRGYMYEGHVEDPDHICLYDAEQLRAAGGIVDYVLGAKPGAGVFVLAENGDTKRTKHLELYKMGDGPLYCFCTPFHLCYLEVPFTIARAVLFGDAAVAPIDGPMVDVVATAKRDLKAGESLDGIGEYTVYGQCENADVTVTERLLPIGVATGCRLLRDVAADEVLRYSDVELPPTRLVDELRAEQSLRWFGR